MVGIIVKSRFEERIGRFVLLVDQMASVVQIKSLNGIPPTQQERRNLEKFMHYKHPEIMNETIQTGWGIEYAMEIPLGNARV